jgi:hypothetical protein
MSKQTINISTPNDGLGDTLRDGMDKCNDNFTELYTTAVEPATFYFTGRTFRFRQAAGAVYLDQTITVLGFAGVENTDWGWIQEFKRP